MCGKYGLVTSLICLSREPLTFVDILWAPEFGPYPRLIAHQVIQIDRFIPFEVTLNFEP